MGLLFKNASSNALLSIICLLCMTSIFVSQGSIGSIGSISILLGTKRTESTVTGGYYVRGGSGISSSNSEAREYNFTMFKLDPMYQAEQVRIDTENLQEKCRRYGLEPFNGPPRRIFFGALVGDENWEVFRMHAIEVYDVYHVAVFIEANSTQTATLRKLRFKDSEERDLLVSSGMFGQTTQVYLNYWLEDWPELQGIDREAEQRNAIIKVWKEAGMKPEDVAVVADVVEVFSRDFLRALQTCDFPELRPGQSCQKAKICPSAISFVGSPYCIKKKEWFHPDIISGQCVEGIGDPTERIIPLRNFKRRYGERHESFGRYNSDVYPEVVHKSGRYPLFNGNDIRGIHGDRGRPYNFIQMPGHGDTAAYGVAYHFNTWFADAKHLRSNYLRFAHEERNITMKTLSTGSGDLDILVRCTRGINNKANPHDWSESMYEQRWNIEGPRPIFFLNRTYIEERHELIQKILAEDEVEYGSSYDADGMWVENTLFSQVQRAVADQPRAAASVKRSDRDKVATSTLIKAETKGSSSVVRCPNSESCIIGCVRAELLD
jgi:hypothetical protein